MSKIVLISCSSKKLNRRARAEDLYISPLFQKSLRYAKSLRPDKMFILSAKYHLLPLSKAINPYDVTLNDMSSDKIKNWADTVLKQLIDKVDINKDEFTILAGQTYWEHMTPRLKNFNIPMKGMRIGEQLEWLTERLWINMHCQSVHDIFNALPKYDFSFTKESIPNNGIYILFQKGEFAHGTNRIVRIGTHTGKDQLPNRLIEHFLTPNKDRSIFRKNIGRAFLNKDKDRFLSKWELDLTSTKAKEKNASRIDSIKQTKMEERVSNYIQRNFNIAVFPVTNKEQRLKLESKIIATISHCTECRPSKKWLGLFSPRKKIRESGLWLEHGLWKTPLSEKNMHKLTEILDQSLR